MKLLDRPARMRCDSCGAAVVVLVAGRTGSPGLACCGDQMHITSPVPCGAVVGSHGGELMRIGATYIDDQTGTVVRSVAAGRGPLSVEGRPLRALQARLQVRGAA